MAVKNSINRRAALRPPLLTITGRSPRAAGRTAVGASGILAWVLWFERSTVATFRGIQLPLQVSQPLFPFLSL